MVRLNGGGGGASPRRGSERAPERAPERGPERGPESTRGARARVGGTEARGGEWTQASIARASAHASASNGASNGHNADGAFPVVARASAIVRQQLEELDAKLVAELKLPLLPVPSKRGSIVAQRKASRAANDQQSMLAMDAREMERGAATERAPRRGSTYVRRHSIEQTEDRHEDRPTPRRRASRRSSTLMADAG